MLVSLTDYIERTASRFSLGISFSLGACKFYDNLPYHTSWWKVYYEYLTRPDINPYARVKRAPTGTCENTPPTRGLSADADAPLFPAQSRSTAHSPHSPARCRRHEEDPQVGVKGALTAALTRASPGPRGRGGREAGDLFSSSRRGVGR